MPLWSDETPDWVRWLAWLAGLAWFGFWSLMLFVAVYLLRM